MTARNCRLIAASPVLHALDYSSTLAYYREVLGFEIQWSNDEFQYGCIERDGVEFNISGKLAEVDMVRSQTVPKAHYDIYVYVTDVDALCHELQERGADVIYKPNDEVYGMREMGVRDPNGYRIVFGQALPVQ